MQQTAKAVMLFEVRTFEPPMREIGALLIECANLVGRALPLMQEIGKNVAVEVPIVGTGAGTFAGTQFIFRWPKPVIAKGFFIAAKDCHTAALTKSEVVNGNVITVAESDDILVVDMPGASRRSGLEVSRKSGRASHTRST